MEKNTVQAKQWLDKRCTASAPSRQMVEKWFADFKRARTNTNDAERSGRINSAVVPENKTKNHNMVLVDRKLELREIADTLKISKGSVFTILHEHFSLGKFIDYLEKGKTINSEYYIALLVRLKQ